MKKPHRSTGDLRQLSRRESQIMEVLLREKEVTVAGVLRQMPDPPGYDAVRTTLRILERKGLVEHREEDARYIYSPAIDVGRAREEAMRHLIRTFFSGSATRAALALLGKGDVELTEAQRQRLAQLVGRLEP